MGRENVGKDVTWRVNSLEGGGAKNEVTGRVAAFVPAHTSATGEMQQRVPHHQRRKLPSGIKDRSAVDRYIVLVPAGETEAGRERKPYVYLPHAGTVDLALQLRAGAGLDAKGGG